MKHLRDSSDCNMHFAERLIQEIATEGLDGVTMSNLLKYLDSEDCNFPMKIDANTKLFLWKTLTQMKCVSFYVNPEEANVEHQGPYDRRKWFVDNKDGLYYEVPLDYKTKKLYPVNDGQIYGSCFYYTERVDVTEDIRQSPDFRDLGTVLAKWGDRLVIVASQEERNNLLFGNQQAPSSLSPVVYAFLEAVARNRYNGLPTTTHDGLAGSGLNASSIWYSRRRLESLGLITIQPYLSKRPPSAMATGVLIHHWRFYRQFPFPNVLVLKRIFQLLQNSPHQACPASVIRERLGVTCKALKRILTFATRQKLVKVFQMSAKACSTWLSEQIDHEPNVDNLNPMTLVGDVQTDKPEAQITVLQLIGTKEILDAWSQGTVSKPGGKKQAEETSDEDEEEEGEEVGDTNATAVTETDSTDLTHHPASPDPYMDIGTDHYPMATGSVDEGLDSVKEYDTAESELMRRTLIKTARKALASAPHISAEDSLSVQFARILLDQEIPQATLMKKVAFAWYSGRRIMNYFERLGHLRTCKRSSAATFVKNYQFLTASERIAFIEAEGKGSSLSVNTQAFNVQTQRQKRREFVLNYLAEHRVVPSLSKIRQAIWDHEKSIGLTVRMDIKSLYRIVNELIASKLIVVHLVRGIHGEVRFYCSTDVGPDDPHLMDAVEKFQNSILRTRRSTELQSGDQILLGGEQQPLSDKAMKIIRLPISPCPRLRRRLLLHQFLYYVIYVLPEDMEPVTQATDNKPAVYCDDYSWRRYVAPAQSPKGKPRGWFAVDDVIHSMPFGLFLQLASLPSLPAVMCSWLGLNRFLDKWSASDLEHLSEQARLNLEPDVPLSEVFLRPLRYTKLPGGARSRLSSWLLCRPRLNTICTLFEELTLHNLITLVDASAFGKQSDFARLIGYLHVNASLLDTRYVLPHRRVLTSLERCSFLRFRFTAQSDVSLYWQACEVIARHTPLGCRPVEKSKEPTPPQLPPFTPHPMDYSPVDDGSLPPILWPEPIEETTADGVKFYPCGACGLHPADVNYLSRKWYRITLKISKQKSEDGMEPSSTIWSSLSSDTIPLQQDEIYWPWSQRLFEEVPLPDHLRLLTQGIPPSQPQSPRKLKRQVGSRRGISATHPVKSRIRRTKHEASTNLTGVAPSLRYREGVLKKAKKALQVRLGIGLPVGRGPRHSWSPLEDKLLVICRVASQLIADVGRRETMCVPYTVLRDICGQFLSTDAPRKTPLAYCRRSVRILFSSRPQAVSAQLLLNRVCSNADLMRKFHYGYDRWHALRVNNPADARVIFKDAVHHIIAEFFPELLPSDRATADEASQAVTRPMSPSFRLGNSRSCIEKDYIITPLHADLNECTIEDAGKSRVAIVVHTLYLYTCGSFRLIKDPSSVFQDALFYRVLHQYPRAQLNQTVQALIANRIATRVKLHQSCEDFRHFNGKRIRLSFRQSMSWFQLSHHLTKYIRIACRLFNQVYDTRTLVEHHNDGYAVLLEHRFDKPTSGGSVAFFLETLLFAPSLDLEINFSLEDITFVGDQFIKEAIALYEQQQQSSSETQSGGPMPSNLQRSMFPRFSKTPACFGDPRFWVLSGYSRRSRWFDQHLSYTGGLLTLVERGPTVGTLRAYLEELRLKVRPLVERAYTILQPSLGDDGLPIDPLEQFIMQGKFGGCTPSDIKQHFGDSIETSTSLTLLLDQKSVYWVGSTVSRFVHRKFVRLWMIHIKPAFHKPWDTCQSDPVQPDTEDSGPEPKRARISSPQPPGQQSPPIPSTSQLDQHITDTAASKSGFFIPVPWSTECGHLKPYEFCALLQSLQIHLVEHAGITLSGFASKCFTNFGPQVIRRLLFWLRDIGAVRLLRIRQQSRPGLFSNASTYVISDDCILASEDELTLIPTPNCVSVVGQFCQELLATTGCPLDPPNPDV